MKTNQQRLLHSVRSRHLSSAMIFVAAPLLRRSLLRISIFGTGAIIPFGFNLSDSVASGRVREVFGFWTVNYAAEYGTPHSSSCGLPSILAVMAGGLIRLGMGAVDIRWSRRRRWTLE